MTDWKTYGVVVGSKVVLRFVLDRTDPEASMCCLEWKTPVRVDSCRTPADAARAMLEWHARNWGYCPTNGKEWFVTPTGNY